MRLRICSCSINIAISLFLLVCIGVPIQAQQQQRQVPQKRQPGQTSQQDKKKKDAAPDTIPLYNGMYVGVDVYGVGNKLLGSDILSSEVSLSVNLKNKFIPTLELGVGNADSWSEAGIHYKSKTAPFFRIGVDYNTMSKKKEKNSYLYAGLRYAFTSFKYNVSTMPISDPIWGDQMGNSSLTDDVFGGTVPFDYSGMKCSMQWVELVLGVKVKVYKNFHMGWAVRMKYKTNATISEHGNPWYVPGYGKFKSNNMGITYSLIYKLPVK